MLHISGQRCSYILYFFIELSNLVYGTTIPSRKTKNKSSSDEAQYLRRTKTTALLRKCKTCNFLLQSLKPLSQGDKIIKPIMCWREYLLVHVDIHACVLLLLFLLLNNKTCKILSFVMIKYQKTRYQLWCEQHE